MFHRSIRFLSSSMTQVSATGQSEHNFILYALQSALSPFLRSKVQIYHVHLVLGAILSVGYDALC